MSLFFGLLLIACTGKSNNHKSGASANNPKSSVTINDSKSNSGTNSSKSSATSKASASSATVSGATSGNAANNIPTATANELLNSFYTVDSQTVQLFNAQGPAATAQINQKFANILTDSQIFAFVNNRTYMGYVTACQTKSTVIAPVKCEITKTSEKTDTVQFNYTASYQATFSSDHHSTTENESGQIGIIIANGSWKVNYFKVLKFSDFITDPSAK
jgi:hypothetical protein